MKTLNLGSDNPLTQNNQVSVLNTEGEASVPVRIQKGDKDSSSQEGESSLLPSTQRRLTISDSSAPEDSLPQQEPIEENASAAEPELPRGSAQISYGKGVPAVEGSESAASVDEQDIAIQRSFTLYKKDCQAIRDMQVHFLQNGIHVTESQAVRIALRVLNISDKLMAMHNQIRSEDGRCSRKGAKPKKKT